MSTQQIILELKNGVQIVRLNRPDKRNSLTRPLLDSLSKLLDELANDSAVRCVLLTGTGKSFCAGADVDEWAEAEANGELETYGWTDKAHVLVKRLAAFPKPTIVALNGSAVGAGVDITLACDFRIAANAASFRCGYMGMAYSPDMGGSWFLPRLVGTQVAKRYVFLNERWSAEDALRVGLVDEVVADDKLLAAALELADKLAAAPTYAIAHTKRLIANTYCNSLSTQLEEEQKAGLLCGRSIDGQEALKAAVEKRAALFIGS